MKESRISGRIWVLAGEDGRLIEDVDTDQIYHNAFLHITDIAEMGQYALGNLKGWEDFPRKARPGDVLAAGRNFGGGSSRQQAVDCFRSLSIGLILAPSFGAIYFRNAVNSGLPVLRCVGLEELVADKRFRNGDDVRVDLRSGKGLNVSRNFSFPVMPMSSIQLEIFEAGGLFHYGRKIQK